MTAKVRKDPEAVRDFAVDWLVPDGDSLTQAVWAVASGDVSINSSFIDGNTAVAWVAGGTLGTNAAITCHAVTADGREGDKTIRLYIRAS